MSERDSSTGEVVLAFLLGAMIGAGLGILFAPKSGKETRKKLSDLSEGLGDKLEHVKDEVINKTAHFVEVSKDKVLDQKERLEAAVEAGKKAYEKKS